ncbi:adenosine deaminase-related growth [Dendrothele bispora CBS 962.96]|uniref:Adenosine deaminase n=1 Tax=Dendrothele bispora (strain CBS 962.96) TaxID=1314807 RepID=A0A4V4HB50_DENBC|nr:adenosine deaminase-related growth [Dendrothele bispora CBS 962.96]
MASDAGYMKRREELIALDRALRADHIRDPLSPTEAKADNVIRELRTKEASTIWNADYPSIPHPFPGMEFLTGRSIIEKTKIFKILSKMPKGAILHSHFDAMGNPAEILKLVLEQSAMHVCCSSPLNSSNLKSILPKFKCLPPEEYPKETVSLTDDNYTCNSWISANSAREMFDPELGGPGGFDRWVIAAMTINPTEAYGTHNTIKKIWQKLATTFHLYEPMIHYEPIIREYFRQIILSAIEDGISYLEIRMNLPYRCLANDCKRFLSDHEIFRIIDHVLNDIKAELKQQGREDEFIGAKVIIATLRWISMENLEERLQNCITLKKEFPHLVAGFDLVGHEDDADQGYPLSHYAEMLLKFPEMQKKAGVDEIPFIFHAGETFGDGTKADGNLYDAILLGTKRIGHGFSLLKHPKLMEICRERDIAIEVCPISNEVLRLTSSINSHPVPALFNHGLRVALSSDDPSMWGCMGLTYDFYQVLVSSELTGIIQLGEVAKDSIKYSMLSSEEKERALLAWQRRWERFLEYVLRVGQELEIKPVDQMI